MEWFAPIRALLLKSLPLLPWLVPVAAGAGALALLIWRRKAGIEPALLVATIGLAGWAQLFVGRREWGYGAGLYGVAALLMVLWLLALRGDRGMNLPQPGRLSRRAEIALALLVVLVAAFARFYRFDQVPYGIEGDESKWSVQTAAEMFLGEHRWDSDYRHKYVPYTYWVEAFFYRLMGISIHTARWQVAFLSVIATALFYLLARRILGPPGALVATFLLAVSITDISVSRFAHVESQIKLPLIASFLCLVYAVDTQRWYWYPLTGLAVVVGLLSFDTYFMAPAVIGLWLGWRLLIDRRVRWGGKLGRLALFVLPILPAAQNALFYINSRRGDHNKSVASLTRLGVKSLAELWLQRNVLFGGLRENLSQTLANFSYQRWGDFSYNRDGPIFEAILIPLAALGLVYLIVRWRRGQNGLAPLWFLLLFFPAALVFGSPYVRVFYPAYPAFYLLAAAALVLLVRTLYRLGGERGLSSLEGGTSSLEDWRAGVSMMVVAVLLLLGANNVYVYLHESPDFPDRIARRELADQVAAHVASGHKVYVPYMPRYGDFLEWEQEFIEFVAWGAASDSGTSSLEGGSGQDQQNVLFRGEYYRSLPYEELLPALFNEGPTLTGVTVIYDHATGILEAERRAVIEAITRCFPGVEVEVGKRIDALVIPQSGLQAPACTTAVVVRPVEPLGEVKAGQAVRLTWETRLDTASMARAERPLQRVEVARQVPGVVWLEAEDLFQTLGWYVEARFAPGFGGQGYLGDYYQAQDATAHVALSSSEGRYTVWARTHRRGTPDMPLTITVAGQAYPAAQHSAEQFNQWRWERLGEVDAPDGVVQVTLHRDYASGHYLSVFIDALAFSSNPGFDPAGGLWPVVYSSPAFPTGAGGMSSLEGQFGLVPPGGTSSVEGRQSPEPALAAGARRWPVQVIVGKQLVDAVLVVDDPAFDAEEQEVWRVLSQPPATPAAQFALTPGAYRWRVQVLDGERIISPAGAVGQWSAWAYFTVK